VPLVWTIFADSGAVLIGIVGRVVLRVEGEEVLPLLVEHTLPTILVGIYIAVVLAAIMSTVDSLLVVASSAAVRDWHQMVRNPDMPDEELVGASRMATVVLAAVALAVSIGVSILTEGGSVFWFGVFGWSEIAATFCPTIILSLFWSRMTDRGALAAMTTGFVAVALFKFGAPHLPGIGAVMRRTHRAAPVILALRPCRTLGQHQRYRRNCRV
jgi:sodium/proline symporter